MEADKKKTAKPVISCLLLALMLGCGKTTEIKECQPEMGRFYRGEHYISSDFLTAEGTWDYARLQKHFESKSDFHPNEECLPLKPDITLPERLRELGDRIDLERK